MTSIFHPALAVASCLVMSVVPVSIFGGTEASTSVPLSFTTGRSHTASATADQPPAVPFSLTISPTRFVIDDANIGETQRIEVVNGGGADVTVVVQKRNFTGRSDGSLDFQDSAPYAASEWVSVDPMSFDIAAGKTKTVDVTVTMPNGPEPGDHQVALVFLVPAGETTANVKINRGIAIPVYVAVPGDIDNSASISALSGPGFATGGPISIDATVIGIGTVHRDFRDGSPLMMSADGGSTAFPDFTVVRDSTRVVSATWDPPFMCICHPTVSIVNADGTVETKSIRVIVFPLQFFAVGIGAVIIVLLGIRLARRRYRNSVVKAAAALRSSPAS